LAFERDADDGFRESHALRAPTSFAASHSGSAGFVSAKETKAMMSRHALLRPDWASLANISTIAPDLFPFAAGEFMTEAPLVKTPE